VVSFASFGIAAWYTVLITPVNPELVMGKARSELVAY